MELDEKTIEDALRRLLKVHNIEPREHWASVRVFPRGIGSRIRYVVIAYPAAKMAVCEVLNGLGGDSEIDGDLRAGIWVLTEPQARLLCDIGARTLGDLLYADKTKNLVHEENLVPEGNWTALVQSMAAGDQRALDTLYERTQRIVFTLAVRITNNRETAEEVTLEVFHGLWRGASTYNPESASVLGWVMNQTRSVAVGRLERRVGPLMDSSISWPINVVCCAASIRSRLARRIAADTGGEPAMPGAEKWEEPAWKQVGRGVSCKLLATDTERNRVSMLVRLAPGAHYPPHTHMGVEELHMLNGELWIDDRKLYPGDYNRAQPGTADKVVWSETGCAGVLITSARDLIR